MRRAETSLLTALLLAIGLASAGATAAKPKPTPTPPPAPTNDDCLACHGDAALKRDNGKALDFSAESYAKSVHGVAGASCTDCHADLATAELPHGEKVAPVACATCHDAQGASYDKSFHAESHRKAAEAKTTSKAALCVDCHGTHGILPSKDTESATNHFKLPGTCLKCHGDPKIYKPQPHESGMPTSFADSIHGRALLKSGLNVAPNCATCHGAHEILRPKDPASAVNRTKVPSTCGTCHSSILDLYKAGVHGSALAAGNPKAPTCISCHSAHEVRSAEMAAWKLDVLKECGTCHEQSLRTYRDTFHGQVTALGFTRVAACSDCHGPHAIFGSKDPRSTVSDANKQKTCQKCHPGVNANFAKYDPHADAHDRQRNPLLHYTSVFMKTLLIAVFSFFGIHSVLWFPRSWRERQNAKRNGGGKA